MLDLTPPTLARCCFMPLASTGAGQRAPPAFTRTARESVVGCARSGRAVCRDDGARSRPEGGPPFPGGRTAVVDAGVGADGRHRRAVDCSGATCERAYGAAALPGAARGPRSRGCVGARRGGWGGRGAGPPRPAGLGSGARATIGARRLRNRGHVKLRSAAIHLRRGSCASFYAVRKILRTGALQEASKLIQCGLVSETRS